jgi:hypothetical protein
MKRTLCCWVALLTAAGLHAAVLIPMSNGDLAAHADVIVIGKCIGSESKWEDRNLFTYTTIAVQEKLKGKPKSNVTVVVPGGIDRKGPVPVAMDYEGPVISPGEEVFLFLWRIEGIPNGYSVVGFSLGKFSIRTEKAGKIVSRDLSGVVFSGKNAPSVGLDSVPLPQFKKEIEKLVASTKGSSRESPRKSR